jgi:hypothetical protein
VARRIRVFLSSPSDVADERRQCVEAVEELNSLMRALIPDRELELEVVTWEADTFPDLTGSPQGVVDSQLGFDYDVFLGIMWARFGTPTESAGSGTENEFRAARQGWSEKRRPSHIVFYFCDADVKMKGRTPAELQQLVDVRSFRDELRHLGLIGSYDDRARFGDMVRKDLALLVGGILRSEQHRPPSREELAARVPPADLAVVRGQVGELAAEYGRIRETMDSGAERTRRMEVVASRMRTMAESLFPLLPELHTSTNPGERLAAVCTLQAIPDRRYLTWLADRLPPETPFVGYHAALALLAAARALPPEELEAVASSLDLALAHSRRLRPDTDRNITLRHAADELTRRRATAPS